MGFLVVVSLLLWSAWMRNEVISSSHLYPKKNGWFYLLGKRERDGKEMRSKREKVILFFLHLGLKKNPIKLEFSTVQPLRVKIIVVY